MENTMDNMNPGTFGALEVGARFHYVKDGGVYVKSDDTMAQNIRGCYCYPDDDDMVEEI